MVVRYSTSFAARTAAVVAVLLLSAASVGFAPAATAAGIFEQMTGMWRGDGSIKYYDGSSEGIRCTAKNEVTEDGNQIKQVLTCANPSSGAPWKITSDLSYREAAGVVTGSWSETNYGLRGHVTGSANLQKIDARVSTSAQNVSVRVSVVTGAEEQTVTMRVNTPEGLTEIFVRMRRA